MAGTARFGRENYIANGMGIPAHDYVQNTYAGDNIIQIEYRLGGPTGDIVAVIAMTYDGSNNLETIHRIQ